MSDNDDTGMGGRFWLGLVGLILGAVIAGVLAFAVFGWIWYTYGFFIGFLVLSVVLIGFGWIYDRRERNRRRELAT